MRRLVTNYSTLEWSADESMVRKVRPSTGDSRNRFINELRVNRMLTAKGSPLQCPDLLGFDVRQRSLTFRSVVGAPLGPKYPFSMADTDIEAIVALDRRLRTFHPRRRWFRRLHVHRRLAMARVCGLLSEPEFAAVSAAATSTKLRLRFCHGDLTARNVLRGPDGPVLIDWEWAGLYPDQYDLAFFWFSLVDVPNGRERVEKLTAVGQEFLLCALVIQLWHLQWFVPPEFESAHLATRDHLLARLSELST